MKGTAHKSADGLPVTEDDAKAEVMPSILHAESTMKAPKQR